MKPCLMIVGADARQQTELHRHLGGDYRFAFCDTPAELDPTRHREPHSAVLVYLDGACSSQTAESYLAELQSAAAGTRIFLLTASGPSPLRTAAELIAEASLSLPVDFEQLRARLQPADGPLSDLAQLCRDLPYKVLHGRTRSLITFTPAMFGMLEELKVAAAHNVSMLLVGETGVGKSFLAQLVHELSVTHDKPVVTLSCSSLPADLIDRELFGSSATSHGDPRSETPGRLAAAGRGTLVLDEIELLPLPLQAKLLRLLETGQYEAVGSTETRHSLARLIFTSNYKLDELVRAGTFRRDLFYRLGAMNFHLQPLRDRPEDIEYLARNFALAASRKHNVVLREIQPQYLDALRHYCWPGNIRELENIVHRSVLYCEDGILTVNHLPEIVRGGTAPAIGGATCDSHNPGVTLEAQVEQFEHRAIQEALTRNRDHRQDTADELGISRVTLYNKMKKLGMLAPQAARQK